MRILMLGLDAAGKTSMSCSFLLPPVKSGGRVCLLGVTPRGGDGARMYKWISTRLWVMRAVQDDMRSRQLVQPVLKAQLPLSTIPPTLHTSSPCRFSDSPRHILGYVQRRELIHSDIVQTQTQSICDYNPHSRLQRRNSNI